MNCNDLKVWKVKLKIQKMKGKIGKVKKLGSALIEALTVISIKFRFYEPAIVDGKAEG